MTESILWIFAGAWALIVLLPITAIVWEKYMDWVIKNFGQERK